MNNIKLIGIRDDLLYQFWKYHIKEIFQELELSYRIEEVNEIDKIINSGVGAIPALIIDNTILHEHTDSKNNDHFFRSILLDYINQKGTSLSNNSIQ